MYGEFKSDGKVLNLPISQCQCRYAVFLMNWNINKFETFSRKRKDPDSNDDDISAKHAKYDEQTEIDRNELMK